MMRSVYAARMSERIAWLNVSVSCWPVQRSAPPRPTCTSPGCAGPTETPFSVIGCTTPQPFSDGQSGGGRGRQTYFEEGELYKQTSRYPSIPSHATAWCPTWYSSDVAIRPKTSRSAPPMRLITNPGAICLSTSTRTSKAAVPRRQTHPRPCPCLADPKEPPLRLSTTCNELPKALAPATKRVAKPLRAQWPLQMGWYPPQVMLSRQGAIDSVKGRQIVQARWQLAS